VVGSISGETSVQDTLDAIKLFQEKGVDLILFAGGDGTARDICQVLDHQQVVLGVPCGVKMHSGVFAVNPKAAADVIEKMTEGKLVSAVLAEVRDIDEEAFREGRVQARFYGEMLIPEAGRFVQQVKSGGLEVEELVLEDIAAWVIETMEPGATYIMGSGSTIAFIMQQLGVENTLLGVDVIRDRTILQADATEAEILALIVPNQTHLVITLIGGQGHLLGRGNQQLSAAVVRAIGRENIIVVSSRSKIASLEGRPLVVDTGDLELDAQLSGLIKIVTGYDDAVLYKVTG